MSVGRLGSTTDLITNLTIFPQVRLRTEISEMFRVGPSPSRHLQSFLHEATHHWCFHSPVGAALSTLALNARIDAVRLVDARTPRRAEILERLTRTIAKQRTAQACLGPFVEGLALFAEFDATPRMRTRIRSTVMDQVAFYFGVPVPGTTDDDALVRLGDHAEGIPDIQRQIDRWLMLTLGKSRMTDACINRKANILVHPLEPRYGYLLGYLFVKTLWDGLARRAPRMRNETDLVLAFLRHHMFQDPRLVSALLAPDGPEQPFEIASSISRLVDERFDELTAVRPEMIDDFEAAIDSSPSTLDNDDFLRSVQIDPAEHRTAIGHLMASGGTRPETIEDDLRHTSALRMAWNSAMAGRAFISMGAMPLTFQVRGNRLICPDEPDLEVSVNEAQRFFFQGGDSELGDGSAELLFVRSRPGLPVRLLLFTHGDAIAGLAAIPAVDTEDLEMWGAALKARTGQARRIIQLSGEMLEMIWPTLLEATDLGQIEELLPDRVHQMYLPWSLVHVKDPEARKQLCESMRERGVRGVLGSAADVRALAAISLAVMRNPWLPLLEAELKTQGIAVRASVEQLIALHERHGFPWVELLGDQILAVI